MRLGGLLHGLSQGGPWVTVMLVTAAVGCLGPCCVVVVVRGSVTVDFRERRGCGSTVVGAGDGEWRSDDTPLWDRTRGHASRVGCVRSAVFGCIVLLPRVVLCRFDESWDFPLTETFEDVPRCCAASAESGRIKAATAMTLTVATAPLTTLPSPLSSHGHGVLVDASRVQARWDRVIVPRFVVALSFTHVDTPPTSTSRSTRRTRSRLPCASCAAVLTFEMLMSSAEAVVASSQSIRYRNTATSR